MKTETKGHGGRDHCTERVGMLQNLDDSARPTKVEGEIGLWTCQISGWGSPNGKGTFGGILLAQAMLVQMCGK